MSRQGLERAFWGGETASDVEVKTMEAELPMGLTMWTVEWQGGSEAMGKDFGGKDSWVKARLRILMGAVEVQVQLELV